MRRGVVRKPWRIWCAGRCGVRVRRQRDKTSFWPGQSTRPSCDGCLLQPPQKCRRTGSIVTTTRLALFLLGRMQSGGSSARKYNLQEASKGTILLRSREGPGGKGRDREFA